MHKIAGLHDKPGRVNRLTRLDRPLKAVREEEERKFL
jgi:hypothetical protein